MLEAIQAVVLDMDGVLWRGDEPLPGLAPFFDFLRAESIPFVLATNNSTKTVDTYVQKLAHLGVQATPENIVTSAVAAADYLRRTHIDGLRVHVLGGPGLHETMRAAGFSLVAADADVVVVGLDPDLTYQKLAQAMQLIRGGARFIGTNGDRTFPLPDRLVPGAGSILAALQACTDQKPLIIGKPEKPMFEIALDRLGTPAGRTLMVGDRLDTDILGGQQAGLRTALLLTGVTTPEALATGSVRPDCVFDDLKALHAAWAAARRARV